MVLKNIIMKKANYDDIWRLNQKKFNLLLNCSYDNTNIQNMSIFKQHFCEICRPPPPLCLPDDGNNKPKFVPQTYSGFGQDKKQVLEINWSTPAGDDATLYTMTYDVIASSTSFFCRTFYRE